MENLVQFKEKLVSFSLDELYQEKEKCERALANMVCDGELIDKLIFIESVISERECGKQNG